MPAKVLQGRSGPYALRKKTEAELDRQVKEDVIFPEEFSEWEDTDFASG